MRRRATRAFLIGFLALLCSGCASIWNSSPGDVEVNSDPEGADVAIDELETSCQTPCELEVKPARYELHISKEGYRTETVKLVKRMSTSFWLNFLAGPYGVIGMGIDWLTGSIMKIDPNKVRIKLTKLGGADVGPPKPAEADEGEEEDEPAAEAPKPPPPKIEADKIPVPPPVAVEPPEAELLPPTPAARKLEAEVPDAYVERQIGNYYGDVSKKRREQLKRRIYRILYEMQQNGERADIDEAIKQEKFRYP